MEKNVEPQESMKFYVFLLIESNKQKTNSGQISSFLDLSAQVELAGQKSNFFEQDLLNLTNLK
jgi:hypothetical protein